MGMSENGIYLKITIVIAKLTIPHQVLGCPIFRQTQMKETLRKESDHARQLPVLIGPGGQTETAPEVHPHTQSSKKITRLQEFHAFRQTHFHYSFNHNYSLSTHGEESC